MQDEEEWQLIPGSSCYEASSLGRVRVWRTEGPVFAGEVPDFKAQLLQSSPTQRGYLHVGVTLDGVERTMLVHRLVALAFLPNPENKPQVNHKNCRKQDNRLANLEWMTGKENMDHARKHRGVKSWAPRGSASGAAVLTEADVHFIRDSLKRGTRTRKELAAKLKVSVRAVCKVANRKSWAHVK